MKYDDFLELLRYRRSIRSFRPDPIPDGHIMKILDAAHYAMSGANSQPWEFIVVKDPETKRKVFDAYLFDWETVWSLEQQRTPEYRHPAFNVSIEEKDKARTMLGGWGEAAVYIAVLYDPRKQFGTVEAGRLLMNETLFRSMGHLGMVIHLAAASLGLGSQRVDVISQGHTERSWGILSPLSWTAWCLSGTGNMSRERRCVSRFGNCSTLTNTTRKDA